MALEAKRIRRDIRKLRKQLKKDSKNPAPEKVHSLRTRIHRVRTAMEALPTGSRRNERRVLRALKRIRKKAGKVRDLDVLTSYASGLRANEETECQVQLLEYLGEERYRHARRLRRTIRRYRDDSRRRLDRAAAWFDQGAQRDAGSKQSVQHRLASSALRMSNELTEPPELTRNNLHPYRLKIKQLRDVLRTSGNTDRSLADALTRAKDAIGEWHDWERLEAIAKELLDHGPNCKLLRQIHANSEAKYESALAAAGAVRNRSFQHTESRQRGARKRQPNKPPVSVLKAVGAIAS